MSILVTGLIIGVLVLLYVLLYMYRRRGDALQDQITGLPSREYFERYLQNCITRSARNPNYRFGVLLIEIEGFPELRKRLGRFAAEEILADFAQRLYGVLRPSDVLTRLEKDNFGVLLEDVRGDTDVPRVALRMYNSMKEIVTLASIELDVSVRIGVSIKQPGTPSDAPTMLSQAQQALDRALSSGRAYSVFDQELEVASETHLALEADLADAVTNHQLELRFQPFVDSRTRVLYGFTALVRWAHPTRGLLQAREFIELAETSRQILQIGEWVIEQSIDALEAITVAAGRDLILTLNVGATEIERGNLDQRLSRALAGRAHLAKLLRIEVPAQVLLTPSTPVDTTAEQLAALDVGLHIDRAGSASIPLWRAIKLGVRGARVDLSAMQGADLITLTRVLAACRSIATEIVVEGVENDAEDAMVRTLDPPVWAQGFSIARPMSLEDAVRVVQRAAAAAVARRTGARPHLAE